VSTPVSVKLCSVTVQSILHNLYLQILIKDEAGRQFGFRSGLRLQILQLLRRCAYHAEVGRALVMCCVNDTASKGGKLYILRRFLDMLKTRLNGREDGKVVENGSNPPTMNAELREMSGFALNMMAHLTNTEVEAPLVHDLLQEADGTLQPVLLLLCDIFCASVHMCLRDSEIPHKDEVAAKFPWIAELKIPVNWSMAPPVAITSHLARYVALETTDTILPLTVKNLATVVKYEEKLTPETKWLSVQGHDVLKYLNILIAFCEINGRTSEQSKYDVRSLFEYMSPMDVEGGTTSPDFRPNVTDRLLDMCLQATLPSQSPGKALETTTKALQNRMDFLLEPLISSLALLCENARNATLVARREGALVQLKSIFVAGTETQEDVTKSRSPLSQSDLLWVAPAVPALFRLFLSMSMHVGGMHKPFSQSIAKMAQFQGYDVDPLCLGDPNVDEPEKSMFTTEQDEKDHKNFIADIERGLHQADPIEVLVKVFKVNSTPFLRDAATCLFLLAENSAEHRKTIVRVEGIKELTFKALKTGVAEVRRTAAFALYRLIKGNREHKMIFMSIEGPEILQRLLREELQHRRHRDLHLRTALQMMLMELATNLECASRLMDLDVLQSVLYALHHVDVSTDEDTFLRDIKSQALARAVQLFYHLLGHPQLSDQIRNAPEFPQIINLLKDFFEKVRCLSMGMEFNRQASREPSIGGGSSTSTASRGSQLQEEQEQERADDKRRETKLLFRKQLHELDLCSRLLDLSSEEKAERLRLHLKDIEEMEAKKAEAKTGADVGEPPAPMAYNPGEWELVDDPNEEDADGVADGTTAAAGSSVMDSTGPQSMVASKSEVKTKPCLFELTIALITEADRGDDESVFEASGRIPIMPHASKYCGCRTIPGRKHVMISYAWGEGSCFQPFAVDLARRLRSCRSKFGVWIDVDALDVGGHIVESFTQAVKSAACVVMLLSKSYAESPSCQSEASTAFNGVLQLKKGKSKKEKVSIPMIPMILEKYESDLVDGIIAGKLYLDVQRDYQNQKISKVNFRKLVKAIKEHVGPLESRRAGPVDKLAPKIEVINGFGGDESPLAQDQPASLPVVKEVTPPRLPSLETLLGYSELKLDAEKQKEILEILEREGIELPDLVQGEYIPDELNKIGLRLGDAKKLIKVAAGLVGLLEC
jgi:hypothetical protein